MKFIRFFACIIFLGGSGRSYGQTVAATTQAAALTGQTVAATPPMGWNSYDCFGSTVREDEVMANADYMAQNLRQAGWQYIVVDFLWSYDNPPGSRIANPYQMNLEDGSFVPWLTMDRWGRQMPQPTKFPSAFGGKGFGPLAAYIHSLGLKFGIHVMRGIPRQAVWAKSPVKGAQGITADMIADTTSTCSWLNHMWGLDMKKPGAQEYLNSLLELYASWGVDFLKVDDISSPYRQAEIEGYEKAIAHCGRPIVLSLSPGATPIEAAGHVTKHANMWRLAGDLWDNWNDITHMMQLAELWEGKGSEGHWPDFDMIPIGRLDKRGPISIERYSKLTEDEQYTLMSFWSICRSPLMLGGNLPENRPLELQLLSNGEVLAADQHGENPRELYHKDGKMVWYSHVQGSKDLYVGLFNLNENAADVDISFASLGLKGKVAVRDLWGKQDIGSFEGRYHRVINRHGAVLIRLSVGTPASFQGSASFEPQHSPWDLAALYQAPKTYPTDSCRLRGFRSFFYEGTIYKAKPARVFAYYKTPPGEPPPGGWPAIICVHGGGGTAFPDWVQAWVDHGYAAIAMDLEGHLPKGEFPNREWYEYAGPPRITTFGDIELADREQWFYQAVADVIRANSLLRSFPEINKNKIGIHGISWGGVITSAVMGLDQRLAFAIPVYGCGFLYQTTCPGFKKYFDVMSDTELKAYKAKWDPSNYLPACSIPVLGYVGSNDPAFPLDIWQKSIELTKGPRMLCIPISNQHGHIWNQKEIFAFADAVVRKGKPLIRIGEPRLLNGVASAGVSDCPIDKMLLCFTRDTCDWQHREWHTVPATMQDGRVYSTLPEGATACYFNITDDRGLVFSSAYLET